MTRLIGRTGLAVALVAGFAPLLGHAAEPPLPPLVQEGAPLPPTLPPEPPESLDSHLKELREGGVESVIDKLSERISGAEEPSPTLAFVLAEAYSLDGQPLEAARLYRETAQANPSHPYSRKGLTSSAAIFEDHGFYGEAAKVLSTYLRSYPTAPGGKRVQLRLGRLQALAGKVGKAREELMPLLYDEASDNKTQAKMWLGFLLADQGRFAQAVERFREFGLKSGAAFHEDPHLLLEAGRSEFWAGDIERASNLLGEAVRRFPDFEKRIEARLLLGKAYARREENRRARDHLTAVEAVEASPDLRGRARVALAVLDHANREGGDLEATIDRLDSIARGLPFTLAAAEAGNAASRLLAEAGRNEEALSRIVEVVRRSPRQGWSLVADRAERLLPDAVDAAVSDGRPFEAYSYYNRLTDLVEPAPAQARAGAFQALLNLGAFRSALRFIEGVRATQGNSIEVARFERDLVREARKAGALGALGWGERFLNRPGSHQWSQALRLEHARLLIKAGRGDLALDYLNDQASLPSSATRPIRVKALLEEGRGQEAERVAEKAWDDLPAALLARIGDKAAEQGRVYAARRFWERSLDAEGLADWEAEQIRVLLGVGASRREDFARAEELLGKVEGDGYFADVAEMVRSAVPTIREAVR